MIYKSSPVWTIKSKVSNHKQPITPSPHAYNPKSTFTLSKSPSWKLGRQQRLSNNYIKQTPCPNQYNPNTVQRSHKHGKFGSEQKLKENIKIIPGPGAYNIASIKNNKASIFNKFCEIKTANIDVPGPGKYQTRQSQLNKKGIKLNKSKRFVTEPAQFSPGPGSYLLEDRPSNPSIAFSRAGRLGNHTQRIYFSNKDFQSTNQKGQKYMINLHPQNCKTPGPGQYSPTNISFSASPSITMAAKFRQKDRDRTPSPTDYNPKFQKVITKVSSYSIGKGQRQPLFYKNDSPGPALYTTNDKFQSKYSAIFVKETKSFQNNQVPGPGTYTPKHQILIQRPKSAKIGKSLRFLNTIQNFPSPLQYKPHQFIKTSQYSFSKGKRMTQKRPSSPGPGSYNISSSISHNSSYVWK